jgi:hypothetical protein
MKWLTYQERKQIISSKIRKKMRLEGKGRYCDGEEICNK